MTPTPDSPYLDLAPWSAADIEHPVGKCSRCRRNPAEPDHPCPYAEEIGKDSETLCDCCEACERECLMDI